MSDSITGQKRETEENYTWSEDTCAFQLWVLRFQKTNDPQKTNKKKNQR